MSGLDLACELLVDGERSAGRRGEQFDRSVVVRRAETPRDDEQVLVQPCTQRGLELGRLVADDSDPHGIDAEPEQRARQIRAVPVLPVAADELRARRDDRGPYAGRQPVDVTMITRGFSPGTCTSLPRT